MLAAGTSYLLVLVWLAVMRQKACGWLVLFRTKRCALCCFDLAHK